MSLGISEGKEVQEAPTIEYLSIYDYQLTPASRIEVTTESGSKYVLLPLFPANLHLLEREGILIKKEKVGNFEDATIVSNPVSGQCAFITKPDQLMVIEANKKELIGTFGKLIRGIRRGYGLWLEGDFGIKSGPVKKIIASNILPDHLSEEAARLLIKHASLVGQDPLLEKMSDTRAALNNSPHVQLDYIANHAPVSTVLQDKVSNLIKNLVSLHDQNLPLNISAEDLEEMHAVFGPLLSAQCSVPYGGMIKMFERKIQLKNRADQTVNYDFCAWVRLIDGQAEEFHLQKKA